MGEPHIKGLSSPQEKRMAQVHQKKDLKPKTHERIGLRAHETEGIKEKAQPIKIRKSKEVQWEELGWDTQRLLGARDPRNVQHS